MNEKEIPCQQGKCPVSQDIQTKKLFTSQQVFPNWNNVLPSFQATVQKESIGNGKGLEENY